MTEEKVFNLLLNIHTNNKLDFSQFRYQAEMIDVISKNATDIIYESLKQKSSTSTIKRGNLLVFIEFLYTKNLFNIIIFEYTDNVKISK